MKTAAEAIYFSFLASLATVILQDILLRLALYICLSRGVNMSNCKSHKWPGPLFIKSNNFAASKSFFFFYVRSFRQIYETD